MRLDDTPQRLDETTPARYTIDRVRQRLGEAMRARLGDNPFAGIVVALANGDSGGVNNAQWDIFRRTGTLHLVAISGLHISLIGGIGFFLGRWLWALPGYTVLRYPAPVVGAVCALRVGSGLVSLCSWGVWFFFQAEDGIRYRDVTGVQTCALPINDTAYEIVM